MIVFRVILISESLSEHLYIHMCIYMHINTHWSLLYICFFFAQDSEEYAIIPYNYGYEVQDPETNNFQNKAEIKTPNGDVFGSYSVLMPDGYIYTTTYNITGDSGYVSRLIKTKANIPETISE